MFWWKFLNVVPHLTTKGFVKRKIYPICYMIGNLLVDEIVLVFLIELDAHPHSLISF